MRTQHRRSLLVVSLLLLALVLVACGGAAPRGTELPDPPVDGGNGNGSGNGNGGGTPSPGTCTEGSPCEISTLAQLQAIGDPGSSLATYTENLDGHYILVNDIDAAEEMDTLPDGRFIPIGLRVNWFSGKFDGNGHVIKNLHIVLDESDLSDGGVDSGPLGEVGIYATGLFAMVGPEGVVTDVTLENVSIEASESVDEIGGLVGLNEGIVTTSSVTGTIEARGPGSVVGGLVGKNIGTVDQSFSTANVDGGMWIGGLVGDNGGIVSNSYATGSVANGLIAGGLVGYFWGDDDHSGEIKHSYSTGTASGDTAAGGLVGRWLAGTKNFSDISSSYWDVGTSDQTTSAGGTGKTTLEMKQAATYDGWESSIWDLSSGDYPDLKNNRRRP